MNWQITSNGLKDGVIKKIQSAKLSEKEQTCEQFDLAKSFIISLVEKVATNGANVIASGTSGNQGDVVNIQIKPVNLDVA